MDVGLRRVSPLKLVGVGGTAILALIGIGLFPPDGRFAGGRGSDAVPANELPVAPTSAIADPDASAGIPGAEVIRDNRTRNPVLIVTVNPTPAETTRPDDDAGDSGGGGGAGAGSGGGSGGADQDEDDQGAGSGSGSGAGSGSGDDGVQTVSCPAVRSRLPEVPAAADAEVEQNLALLAEQIREADARLVELAEDPVDDPNFIQNTVLGPLRDNRFATLDRIAIAIGRHTTQPTDLGKLAPCKLSG